MENLKINRTGTTLVDQVEEKLIEYFKDNNLRPGSSIPNENELATYLGIGRTVLREALSRFKMTGMIESRTKRGMILAEPSILCSLRRCVNPLLMNPATLREIFEFRLSLEVGSTRSLFEHVTEADIEELEKIVAEEESSDEPYHSIEKCCFHEKIHKIINNKIIMEFQETILPALDYIMEMNRDKFSALIKELGEKNRRLITHRKLLELIKQGDELAYIEAITSHFEVYYTYLDAIEAELQDA